MCGGAGMAASAANSGYNESGAANAGVLIAYLASLAHSRLRRLAGAGAAADATFTATKEPLEHPTLRRQGGG